MEISLAAVCALLLIAGASVGSLYLIACAVIVCLFPKQPIGPQPVGMPVTILKPLCGVDHELAANLRSFCRQDYPEYQIVFGVQRTDDPAIAVVRQLINEFPQLDIALVIDTKRQSHNLKIANLQNMLPAARHPYLVMADSDMRVSPCYLSDVVSPLADSTVGAVTCLYRGVSGGGFWSNLGCMHLNHSFLPQAILGEMLKIGDGCFGATIAIHRAMLGKIGGLSALGHALADDHVLGQLLRKQGKKVILSSHIVDNVITEPDLSTLFRHELRWARTIYLVQRYGYMGSVVTFPVMLALLAVLTMGLPALAVPVLIAVMMARLISALAVTFALRLPLWSLALVPVRDVLSFAVFLTSFCGNAVHWRGQKFHINPNGSIILDGDPIS